MGPITDPCGTPLVTYCLQADKYPSIQTLCSLPFNQFSNHRLTDECLCHLKSPNFSFLVFFSKTLKTLNGVTRVGVIRARGGQLMGVCVTLFFFGKNLTTFLTVMTFLAVSSPHHSHLPTSFIQCSF